MNRRYAIVLATMLLMAFGAISAQAQMDVAATIELNAAEGADGNEYLVDAEGNALYAYVTDGQAISRCYDDCAEAWPPLRITAQSDLNVTDALDTELIGRTGRMDGTMQVSYNGRPLYRFANDEAAGDTKGHGVGDAWYLVAPDGELVPAAEQETGAEEVDAEGVNDVVGAADSAPEGRSVSSGVFTQAQADRGAETFDQTCATCHGTNLRGGPGGPGIAGGRFTYAWGDRSVGELFTFIKENMPPGRAGMFSDQEYLDIVAHILAVNGFPAGDEPLPLDQASLDAISLAEEE